MDEVGVFDLGLTFLAINKNVLKAKKLAFT